MKEFILNIIDKIHYHRAKDLYFKYESYFSPLALLSGFVIDSLTLRRIDLWAENLVILSYLVLALLSILYLSAYEAGRIKYRWLVRPAKLVPFFLQFIFGGLFSVFFVFYSRSASISASWVFLLLIVGLLVGNEFFRTRYQRLSFRLGVYFIVLFFYSVFAIPLLLKEIGTDIFLLSSFVALLAFGLVIILLYSVTPRAVMLARAWLFSMTVVIFLLFQFAYFANLIPPIPLSVKESGIFHELKREGSGYQVAYEKAPWYMFWQDHDTVVHWQSGRRIYCYTAVFSPALLDTNIYHRWAYYNESSKEWETASRLGFPIVGGRDGGYRGYSFKNNVWPGRWRVDVVTEKGQIMGRIKFRIVNTNTQPELTFDKR